MRIALKTLLLTALCGLVLIAGCERGDSPLATGDDKAALDGPLVMAALDDNIINDFRVHYDGRVYADGQTTFRWTVSGTGQGPALDYFMIELPDCAPEPIAWEPRGDVRFVTNRTFDVYGIKWVERLNPLDLVGRQYAIVFPGDVSEGAVRAIVNAAEPIQMGGITGPCVGFRIAGNVFVDVDADGFRDPATESGIGDVIVEIIDADAQVDTVRTDADGTWQTFRAGGTYTVRVDTLNYADAFNPELGLTFDATTPLDQEVIVGPDVDDVDFGFAIDADTIVEQLENDELPTAGEGSYFWKRQLKVADYLENRFEDPPIYKIFYGPVQMHIFMDVIRHLYLVDPFVFDPETELLDAYWVLRTTAATDVDLLRQQLLIAELNFVSGQGIVGEREDLLGPLLAWGENILYEALNDDLKAKGGSVTDAIRVFEAVNTGGGGSIDD